MTCWIQDFITVQGSGSPVAEADFYTELEAYIQTPSGQEFYNKNMIGYVGNELKFTQIVALTPEAPFQGRTILHPIYKQWEDLKDEINSQSPPGINAAFQTGGFHFAWLETESEMLRGVIQGIIISLIFAFFILVFSTLNIFIAIYATS